EYGGVKASHPARELLASLTDPHALAWIAARLADALDHASGRGVAHGDVKPSNILLTANGTPMLLDFNLARDWPHGDAGLPAAAPRGTPGSMDPATVAAAVT